MKRRFYLAIVIVAVLLLALSGLAVTAVKRSARLPRRLLAPIT